MRLRQRVHVHLLAARGHRGGDDARPGARRRQARAARAARRRRPAGRRGAKRERVGRVEEVLVEGPSRTDSVAPARPHAPEHHRQLRGRARGRASSSTCSSRARRRRRCAGARSHSSPPDAATRCTVSARFVTHACGFRSLRSQRVVGRGAPRDMTVSPPRSSRSSGRLRPASRRSPSVSPTASERRSSRPMRCRSTAGSRS